jgi:glutamyl-tRNA synthetase
MAWSMPDEREKFSLDEMLEHFDLDRVSLGGPVFEVDKLNWLSGLWMRDLGEDEFAGRVADWALNPAYLRQIIPLVQSRTNQLSDLGSLCTHFFQGLLNLNAEQLLVKQLQPAEVQKALTWTLWGLDAEPAWTAAAIDAVLGRVADLLAVKRRILLAPVFIAVTGKPVSTPLYATMAIIGRDLSRARIQQAIDVLGPVGKKLVKRWDKEYRAAGQALAEAAAHADDATAEPSNTETP